MDFLDVLDRAGGVAEKLFGKYVDLTSARREANLALEYARQNLSLVGSAHAATPPPTTTFGNGSGVNLNMLLLIGVGGLAIYAATR